MNENPINASELHNKYVSNIEFLSDDEIQEAMTRLLEVQNSRLKDTIVEMTEEMGEIKAFSIPGLEEFLSKEQLEHFKKIRGEPIETNTSIGRL